MKKVLNILTAIFISVLCVAGCNSNRSNTEADREATYTQDGDTINPTEGTGEGSTGHKYMETTDSDSGRVEQ